MPVPSRSKSSVRRLHAEIAAGRQPGDVAHPDPRGGATTPLPGEESPPATNGRPAGGRQGGELGHLARSGSYGLFGQFSSSGLAFVFALLVAHLFRASGTGLFFEALALVMIGSTLAALGADTTLTRTIPRYLAERQTGDLRRLMVVGVLPPLVAAMLFAVGMAIGAPELARVVIHGPGLSVGASYLRTLAPFLPMVTLSIVLFAGTRGFETMGPLVGIQLFGVPLLRVLLLLAFVGAGFGTLGIAVAWGVPAAVGAVAGALSLTVLTARTTRHTGLPRSAGRSWRSIASGFWRFSVVRGLSQTCATLILWFDLLLVGALISTRQAGIYAAASRYSALATYAVGALGVAFAPQLSRLLTQPRMRPEAGRAYRGGTAWLMAVSWPLCLTMALFAPILMRLFGPGFASGAAALSILSLAMLVTTGTGNNNLVLVMAGGNGANLAIVALSVAINVSLNLWLIPVLGINGSALAWAATMVVSNLVTAAVLYLKLGFHPFSRAFAWVSVSSLACFGVLGIVDRLVLGPTVAGLATLAAIGGVLYLFSLWMGRHALDLHAFATRGPAVDVAT